MDGHLYYLVVQKMSEPPQITVTWRIRIKVYYSKGGRNFANGTTEPRAFWCSITPVEIKDGMEYAVLGHGLKYILKQVGRLDRKELAIWFNRVREELSSLKGEAAKVLFDVLQREGMRLADVAITVENP
jgi:hypothetical protein